MEHLKDLPTILDNISYYREELFKDVLSRGQQYPPTSDEFVRTVVS